MNKKFALLFFFGFVLPMWGIVFFISYNTKNIQLKCQQACGNAYIHQCSDKEVVCYTMEFKTFNLQ